jgi:hypothetical protein
MFYKDDGSIDYVDLSNELASMIHGYPYSEPPETLGWIAGGLKADPGGRHGRAMMAAAWASRWYTKWQITDVSLFDDLIEAAARAEEVFDAAGCTAPGEHEHPEIDADDPEGAAGVVALIGAPEAWLAADPLISADDKDTKALNCPGSLGRLAAETVEDLRDARKERFEAPATDHLDERYLTGPWGSAAPGVVTVYRKALQTFDTAPLDQPCPHPEGHPDVKTRDTPRHARALISPVAESDEHGERCPRRVAELIRETAADSTEYPGCRGRSVPIRSPGPSAVVPDEDGRDGVGVGVGVARRTLRPAPVGLPVRTTKTHRNYSSLAHSVGGLSATDAVRGKCAWTAREGGRARRRSRQRRRHRPSLSAP